MFGRPMLATIAILTLTLGGCGKEPVGSRGEARGLVSDPGPIKADNTNSCVGHCNEKAPSGCWCDLECVEFGDCCPDQIAACRAPHQTCADVTCEVGTHCELKGINGGELAGCVKDVVTKTCQDLGGTCLPLTNPASACQADEKAETTAGLCQPLPGSTSTCCVKASPATVVITESDDGGTIPAKLGSTVEVKLAGNLTTGYQWTLVSPSQNLPLESTTYKTDPAPQGWVGVGGTHSFFFKVGASAAGAKHTLGFAFARSWEPQPLKTFSVTIDVP